MAVTLNKANLVLKDANGNVGKIEQLSDRDLAKIRTAMSDVALVVNQSNHTPIEATTTNKGVVQLATPADVVAGASDKVVTAEQLHNATTTIKATLDGAGNVITDTYVKKTGDETISGVKTFTGTINTNGFIGFNSTVSGIGGGFANYLNNNRVCDVWGQPQGVDNLSFIHLRIKDYQSDDNLAYLQIAGDNQTKQGSIAFNDKNLVRSVNGTNADVNGNVTITSVANATKATQDSVGNVITDTYVKKTGDETISGVKTFTGTINTNGFIGFNSTVSGIGGGFANYLNNNRVCDVWGQPQGVDNLSFIHLRIKDYQSDDNLAYLQIAGDNQTKQGSIAFNGKNLVRSVNGVNADVNGNVKIGLGVYLVKSWVSNRSWYRVWSDGWCEQGTTSSVSHGNNTITLLKAFRDNQYNVLITDYDSVNEGSMMHAFLNGTFNTSNFIVQCEGDNHNSVVTWRAYGYVTL